MGKIRKNVRRKKFRYQVNRKRLNKSKDPTPGIACNIVKKSWNSVLSTRTNMRNMGLAHDLNKPPPKKPTAKPVVHCPEVVKALEDEATAPRRKAYRMPNNQVSFLIEMLDKYGEDYIEMAKDKKNYGQLTPKQLRRKVVTLKKIPEQFQELMSHRKGKHVDTSGPSVPKADERDEWM